MMQLLLFVLYSVLLVNSISSRSSPEDACDAFPHAACPFLPGNILTIVPGLASISECQYDCQVNQNCGNWSYFPFQAEPTQCYLFKTCDTTTPCDRCTSGPAFPEFPDECDDNCGKFFASSCGLNPGDMVGVELGVVDPMECQTMCKDAYAEQCSYFTWASGDICFLFNNCRNTQECEDCLSGPVDPSVDECQVAPSFPRVALVIGGQGDMEELTSSEVASPDISKQCLPNVEDLQFEDGRYYKRSGMVGALDSAGVVRVCTGTTTSSSSVAPACHKLTSTSLTWEKMPPPTSKSLNHAAALVFQGSMFLLGGEDLYYNRPTNLVEQFDTESNRWVAQTSMPTAKHSFCAVNVDDKFIYTIGGETETEYLRETNKLEVASGQWTTLESTVYENSGQTCAVTSYKSIAGIMVIGGKYRESIEMGVAFFNLETNQWNYLTHVKNQPRFYHGIINFGEQLFIFGGQETTEHSYLDDGALLVGDNWTNMPRVLRTRRSGFAYVAVNDTFNYAIC